MSVSTVYIILLTICNLLPHLRVYSFRMKVAAKTVSEIHLGVNRISAVPSSVGDFSALLMLDMQNNKLISLPYELGSCLHLRELIIAYNKYDDVFCRIIWYFCSDILEYRM